MPESPVWPPPSFLTRQWKQFDDRLGRFDIIPACDRQTDRQTGRQTDRQADRQTDVQPISITCLTDAREKNEGIAKTNWLCCCLLLNISRTPIRPVARGDRRRSAVEPTTASCRTPWWHWFGRNATSLHPLVARPRTFCWNHKTRSIYGVCYYIVRRSPVSVRTPPPVSVRVRVCKVVNCPPVIACIGKYSTGWRRSI